MSIAGIQREEALIHVPRPQLKMVANHTPFRHFRGQKMGKGRTYHDVVVLKGTFDLGAGALPLSSEQAEIALADRYHDREDAARSSLEIPGDLLVGKPTTDVIVTGHARAPGQRPLPRWECSVTVERGGARLLESTAIATGPRRFIHRALSGWRLSEPEPTVEVPIRYELAYGGWYENPRATSAAEPPFIVDRTNPSGAGVFDEARLDKALSYGGPQWELRSSPVTSINEPSPLVGFGPVARPWRARLAFAGTYDDAWDAKMREDVALGLPPDYPADFDLRFFQCAHPSLVAPTPLRGGDLVRLRGFTEAGDLDFEIPRICPRGEVVGLIDDWADEPLALDLVHIDLDARRVCLTWRMSLASERVIVAALLSTDTGSTSS